MTKQEMIDLINQFDDNADFTFPSFWVREDVEGVEGEPLTDTQWQRFCEWFEKYQNSHWDYETAIDYALGSDN